MWFKSDPDIQVQTACEYNKPHNITVNFQHCPLLSSHKAAMGVKVSSSGLKKNSADLKPK
jgi:hypothetical protein